MANIITTIGTLLPVAVAALAGLYAYKASTAKRTACSRVPPSGPNELDPHGVIVAQDDHNGIGRRPTAWDKEVLAP